jgi:hypothetical protein
MTRPETKFCDSRVTFLASVGPVELRESELRRLRRGTAVPGLLQTPGLPLVSQARDNSSRPQAFQVDLRRKILVGVA